AAVDFDYSRFIIAEYLVPSITVYNRLEAIPRATDFDRSLKAEVRDAMWMLTRQWQFGEFKGEDAATAVTTKVVGEHTTMNTIHFGDNAFPYDPRLPLETVVEREMLGPNLALSVQMGRYFIRLIKSRLTFTTLLDQLIGEYPLSHEPDPNDVDGIHLLRAVQGKVFDGFNFYNATVNGNVPAILANTLTQEIEDFKNWFRRSHNQPETGINPAWDPSQLEYQFAVSSASGETTLKKLSAGHYPGGHLDWYEFDMAQSSSGGTSLVVESVQSYIPTPLSFRGMPNPRFWMMEESVTDFGRIDTTPTGLLHLLLAEFGLTCSNDWFMLPYQLDLNTLCEMKGILVKDVFGEYTLVRPAGKGPESQWHRWTMFHHTNLGGESSSSTNSFYLVPGSKALEGLPLEQVNFLRDEMANMVWGVESIVPSQSGKGTSGDEMVLEKPDSNADTEPLTEEIKPKLQYILGTRVPANWIPFIPVHMENSNAEIRLQRAKLPAAKPPMGVLLTEKSAPYFIDEKTLDSSGLLVSRTPQLARYINGASCLWIGRKKEAGKGLGWSNLKFDQTIQK
ncbi:MAG TPA: hypothetical protein VFW11_11915, partial [Cyclobacteriaceae bacterium]|nr:hypothetical protein [Cyclobacteriaceae bacterium]